MFKPYPSTVRIWGFCFNLMLRAVIVTLTWSGLLLTGMAFNWLINYVLESVGAHESARSVSSAIVLVFVLSLMVSAALTGLSDIFALTKAAIGGSSQSDRTENSRGCD